MGRWRDFFRSDDRDDDGVCPTCGRPADDGVAPAAAQQLAQAVAAAAPLPRTCWAQGCSATATLRDLMDVRAGVGPDAARLNLAIYTCPRHAVAIGDAVRGRSVVASIDMTRRRAAKPRRAT